MASRRKTVISSSISVLIPIILGHEHTNHILHRDSDIMIKLISVFRLPEKLREEGLFEFSGI